MSAQRKSNPITPLVGLLAVAGGVAMIASLFMNWYGVEGLNEDFSVAGVDAFEFIDVLIALIAVGAIVSVIVDLASGRAAFGDILMMIGVLAVVTVGFQLFNKPPVFEFFAQTNVADADIGYKEGFWVGLVGSVCLLLAGVLQYAGAARSATPGAPPPPAQDPPPAPPGA